MKCSDSLNEKPKSNISTLQIPNSLGDKFSQWDSQNETLIIYYGKKTETTLNVSYFEKIMSHWEYI